MKRIRKGIVVLVVAAGAAGMIGTAASAQAARTPIPTVKAATWIPVDQPNGFGSSWQ